MPQLPTVTLMNHFRFGPPPDGFTLLLVTVLLVLGGPSPADAQESRSPVFPTERHRELMKKLDFSPPEEEKETEEKEAAEEASGEAWWDRLRGDWFDGSDGNFSLTSTTSGIIFSVLILLLGLLIYRILGDVSLRKRKRGKEDDEDRIVIGDIEEEQLIAEGVSLSLLEQAERGGQFDVAVRLLYIQLLKELQDAGLIKYRRNFSNRDYQHQLHGKDVLADFHAVTTEYQRYWFGKYPVDRLSYRNTYLRFTALNERIRTDNAASHV